MSFRDWRWPLGARPLPCDIAKGERECRQDDGGVGQLVLLSPQDSSHGPASRLTVPPPAQNDGILGSARVSCRS